MNFNFKIRVLSTFYFSIGAVAQLARALPWHGRGQGFESPQLHHSSSPERRMPFVVLMKKDL